MTQDTPKTFNIQILPFVKMKNRLEQGDVIDASELADALRTCGGNLRGFDDIVREHIARHLEGKVTKQRGRKPRPPHEERQRRMIIWGTYQQYLGYLQARKARTKQQGRRRQKPTIWDNPIHETAARLTARLLSPLYLPGPHSVRTVLNIASKYRSRE